MLRRGNSIIVPLMQIGCSQKSVLSSSEGLAETASSFLLISSPKKIPYSAIMKLTKYGWPQVLICPAAILTAMLLCLFAGPFILPKWAILTLELILATTLLWILYFFRDPSRKIPPDKNILLSPADGKITDIEKVENDYIGSNAIRIGIFLNIFDVHINRAPCNVKVLNIFYKKGSFKNAANPASGRTNESNDLLLVRTDEPKDKIVVRQISGAIARRIVCKTAAGQNLTGGQKFGMIKFGSRTEILLPDQSNIETFVKVGDKVRAGVTPLVKYIL